MSIKADIQVNSDWIIEEANRPRGQVNLPGVIMTAQRIRDLADGIAEAPAPEPEGPTPVDCVMSEWALAEAGPWGECESDGTQTRDETWTRTVVTPAAHGGKPCGVTEQLRIGERTCVYVPPTDPKPDPDPLPDIPNPGTYPYFERLSALPNCINSQSLRVQDQINALGGVTVPKHWQYDPAEDAVRLITRWTPENPTWNIPGTSHLWFALNRPAIIMEGSVLLAFDWKWGPEFRDLCGAVTHYKWCQFQVGGKGWWTLKQSPGVARGGNTGDPRHVAVVSAAIRAGHGDESGPVGMESNEPVHPAGAGSFVQGPGLSSLRTAVPLLENTWYRHVVELRIRQRTEAFTDWNEAYGVTVQPNPDDPDGCWHMISHWVIGEDGQVHRVLYRVPMSWTALIWNHWPTALRFEINSSKTGALGQLKGWSRNFVALRDYPLADVNPESDTRIFEAP